MRYRRKDEWPFEGDSEFGAAGIWIYGNRARYLAAYMMVYEKSGLVL